jgi:hypothetical protein
MFNKFDVFIPPVADCFAVFGKCSENHRESQKQKPQKKATSITCFQKCCV